MAKKKRKMYWLLEGYLFENRIVEKAEKFSEWKFTKTP
jgi:hypothetical protein